MVYGALFQEHVVKGLEGDGSYAGKVNTAGTVGGSLYNQTIHLTINAQNCVFYRSSLPGEPDFDPRELLSSSNGSSRSSSICYSVAKGMLQCKNCSQNIGSSAGLLNLYGISSLRTYEKRMTIAGMKNVLVQHFRNPYGYEFDVFTCDDAHVLCASEATTSYTWFEDYTWTISLCPNLQCKTHLGWAYDAVGDTTDSNRRSHFFGLIEDKISYG